MARCLLPLSLIRASVNAEQSALYRRKESIDVSSRDNIGRDQRRTLKRLMQPVRYENALNGFILKRYVQGEIAIHLHPLINEVFGHAVEECAVGTRVSGCDSFAGRARPKRGCEAQRTVERHGRVCSTSNGLTRTYALADQSGSKRAERIATFGEHSQSDDRLRNSIFMKRVPGVENLSNSDCDGSNQHPWRQRDRYQAASSRQTRCSLPDRLTCTEVSLTRSNFKMAQGRPAFGGAASRRRFSICNNGSVVNGFTTTTAACLALRPPDLIGCRESIYRSMRFGRMRIRIARDCSEAYESKRDNSPDDRRQHR